MSVVFLWTLTVVKMETALWYFPQQECCLIYDIKMCYLSLQCYVEDVIGNNPCRPIYHISVTE